MAVDRDILEGVATLVKEVGFSRLTLPAIAQASNVNLSVICRHFGTLENLLEVYTHKFDYWLATILDINKSDVLDDTEFLNSVAGNFVKTLSKDKEMQQLMAWELTEDNPLTRRSAKQRDVMIEKTLPVYERYLNHLDANPRAILAIVVAGMYYIVLRKDHSKFCSIDFSTKSGKQLLSDTMVKIIAYLNSIKEQKDQMLEVAGNLKKNHVEERIILESTKISKEEFDLL